MAGNMYEAAPPHEVRVLLIIRRLPTRRVLVTDLVRQDNPGPGPHDFSLRYY